MWDEKNNKKGKIKVAYLHGRPGAHKMHQNLAKLLNADFYYVDFLVRWQDRNLRVFHMLLSWILCAVFQKNAKKYDVFLVDNLHISPVLLKYLRLNRKKQKIAVHLASHTLYFLKAKKFGYINTKLQLWALKHYDGIICEGKMAVELVNELLPGNKLNVYYSFNGLSEQRDEQLTSITPDLSTKNILTIAQIAGAEFRLWYKGIDLMLDAFEKANKVDPDLRYYIVGEFDHELLDRYTSMLDPQVKKNIFFVGYSNDLPEYYAKCSLCLHATRGDAFPTTTIETLRVGIPTLITNTTGTKEIISQIDKDFICEMNSDKIAKQINKYFNHSSEELLVLSNKCKKAVIPYSEKNSYSNYIEIINSISSKQTLN